MFFDMTLEESLDINGGINGWDIAVGAIAIVAGGIGIATGGGAIAGGVSVYVGIMYLVNGFEN